MNNTKSLLSLSLLSSVDNELKVSGGDQCFTEHLKALQDREGELKINKVHLLMGNEFSGARLDMGRLVGWWLRPGLQQRDGKDGQFAR